MKSPLTTEVIAKCFGVVMMRCDSAAVCADVFDIVDTVVNLLLCGETVETSWRILQNVIDGGWTQTSADRHIGTVLWIQQ